MSESDQSDPNHYSDIDPEYLQFYTPVYIVTTSISLSANLAVIVFHWLMSWYKVAEFNRVSLRLIVLACCIGTVRSIVRLCMSVPADTVTCLVDSFFLGWTEIAAPLCLGMVGVHAVCVLVLNVKNPLRQEKYYYMIILLYSLVTSIVTVTHRTINYPEDFYCWVRFYFGSKASQPFAWVWYFTLLLLPMTLAAFCSLTLAIRYRMERHNFVETSVRYAQNNNPYLLPAIPNRRRRVDPIKTFRNLVIRSAFYALVPLITKIFLVISGLTSLRGYSTNFYALMIGGVITNIQGLLISILYFSDPAVTFTFGRLGRFLRRVYVDEYQLPDDKPADDKAQLDISGYDSDDLRDGDESEDDIGGVIRIAHDKHDMIAAETNTMEPANERYRHSRQCYWKQHHGHHPQNLTLYYQRAKMDHTRRMQDPYRYRWFAKAMHYFLTSVCRLKPLPPTSDSMSTLSYHSRTLSRLSTTHTQVSSNLHLSSSSICGSLSFGENHSSIANKSNSTSITTTSNTNTNTSNTDNKPSNIVDKYHVPAVRFDFSTNEDQLGQKDTWKAAAASDDHQQLLSIPRTTSNSSVSPHDSALSAYSSDHLVPSSLDSSSRVELSDDSDAKVRGMGKAMASSKLAQQSKKLRQAVLPRSPDISLDSQQIALQISPASSNVKPQQHTPLEQPPLLSSHHLSPISSEEDIDRLSLLSYAKSIDGPSNEQYEPLSAPPHYYQQRRQHLHFDKTPSITTTTTPTTTLPTPQLSITLPDQEVQQDQTIGKVSFSTLSPAATKTMELTPPGQQHQPPQQQAPGLKHGVALAPAVLKTLLDWGPRNTFYPAYIDHLIMESDGLGYGYTQVIHIQQSWPTISAHGSFSKENESSTLGISDGIDDDDGDSISSSSSYSRLVFYVEHWVKGYLGSRWFVVE